MYNKFRRLRQFSQKEDKHEEIDHQSTQSIDGSLLDAAHNIRVSRFYTFFRKLLVYAIYRVQIGTETYCQKFF